MLAATTMAAHATDYTDQLLVLVNGEGAMQQATISVNEHDGLYDLNLKNFVLMNGDQPMPVGNVELKNIVPEAAGDAIFLRANQNITVTDGGTDAAYALQPAYAARERFCCVLRLTQGRRLRASGPALRSR